tara:strand:+ start:2881 stop:3861 length:981 start_codon:yes stop_codon:yes gene_type:complete
LNKKILITGCAGFIGFHTSLRFLEKSNYKIIGIDNLNNYYDKNLKINRLKILKKKKNFNFLKIDITKENSVSLLKKYKIDYIIHLAAQAGVRYSIKKPKEYLNINIIGFFNILELAKNKKVKHFVYASTSSVYGDDKKPSLSENLDCNQPIQFYAATKKSNEAMATSYSYIHKLPTTGLRFFTVYGPWGRPDMAFYKFVKNIKENKKIEIFNSGNHFRDFSYVKNIADGVFKACFRSRVLRKKSIKRNTIYNLGNGNKINLMYAIKLIEEKLNKKSKKKLLPLQKGDIKATLANISKAKKDLKIKSGFSLKQGLSNFIDWYNFYHN